MAIPAQWCSGITANGQVTDFLPDPVTMQTGEERTHMFVDGQDVVESRLYEYVTSGVNEGRLLQVTFAQRRRNSKHRKNQTLRIFVGSS